MIGGSKREVRKRHEYMKKECPNNQVYHTFVKIEDKGNVHHILGHLAGSLSHIAIKMLKCS